MPETADLATIAEALSKYQRIGMSRYNEGVGRKHLRLADAAILALERLRVRLANSVPAEQGELSLAP